MGDYIKKTNNPKMGRPKIEIDVKDFEKLCGMMCTEEEIAGFFNCSVDTIEKFCKREYKTTFTDIYKTLSTKGKIALRRNQFRLSETNTSMAIWLGKQYLGQKEITDIDLNANIPSDGLFEALSNGLMLLGKNKDD